VPDVKIYYEQPLLKYSSNVYEDLIYREKDNMKILKVFEEPKEQCNVLIYYFQ
jgi:hypothetical protein